MEYFSVHNFDLTKQEMLKIQKNLRKYIKISPLETKPSLISGVDVTYTKTKALAVIVTWDFINKKIIECTYAVENNYSDYKPEFLAFHELPAFLKAWTNLCIEPDIVVFDGYGYTHPRRVGLATHASFFINKPTFGIAKTPFIGNFSLPSNTSGDFTYIKYENEIVGLTLRTVTNLKPIYLSIGNYITLEEVLDITNYFRLTNSKIPILTSLPDKFSKKLKNLIRD